MLNKQKKKSNIGSLIALLIISLLILNCAALEEFTKTSKPKVNVQQVRFVGMTFDKIDLAFDIKIQNPNPLSIKLAGFDYDFQINNASFVKGQKSDQLAIAANGESLVEIPLTLGFKYLYNSYQSLKNQDSSEYKIDTKLYFDLPILGRTPIPISKTGNLPLIKLPKIKIGSLKLKKVGFSGADLELKLNLSNPNSFKLFINQLNYDFSINGQNWITGKTSKQTNISEKNDTNFIIPISLDFLKMGRTVYNLIQGDTNLNYKLDSNINLKTSIPMIGQVKIPLNKSGQVNLIK